MGLIKENDSSRPVSLIPLNQHLLKEPKMFYIKILDDSSWRKDSKWAQTQWIFQNSPCTDGVDSLERNWWEGWRSC